MMKKSININVKEITAKVNNGEVIAVYAMTTTLPLMPVDDDKKVSATERILKYEGTNSWNMERFFIDDHSDSSALSILKNHETTRSIITPVVIDIIRNTACNIMLGYDDVLKIVYEDGTVDVFCVSEQNE